MRQTLTFLLIVSLISYDSFCQEGEPPYKWIYISQISSVDSLETLVDDQLRANASTITASNSIEQSRIINQRRLRKNDNEVLLDVLFNGNERQQSSGESNCYTPSNGLLFYDKHDGLLGFIELSIDCMEYRAIGICAGWDMKLDSTDYEYLEKWFDQNFE